MVGNKILTFRNAVTPLIFINIFVFILQIVLGIEFTRNFMLVSQDLYIRPWILITSMFLHGGSMHLLFNMYALLIFGSLIEQRIGTKRFLLIYFLSGILAGFIPTYEAALGASGAIMGIIGVTIMLMPDLPVLLFFFIPMSLRTAGIIFAVLDLFGMFTPIRTGIAHYSHLVGLVCGLLYGFYLLRKKKSFIHRFTRRPKKENANLTELSKEEIEDYLKYGRL